MVLLELHGERRKKLYLACSTREPRISRESYKGGPGSLYIGEGPGCTKWWEPGYRLDRREVSRLSQAGWSTRATAFYGASRDSCVPR